MNADTLPVDASRPLEQERASSMAVALDAMNFAKQHLREQAVVSGYGYYRPQNPNDFHPDAESCSADEIAAHKAACEAWDRGDFKRDDWDGWMYDEAGKPVMHVLRAPWGIGSYCEVDDEMEARAQALHKVSEAYPLLTNALRMFLAAGVGNSTDPSLQADAYAAARSAIKASE